MIPVLGFLTSPFGRISGAILAVILGCLALTSWAGHRATMIERGKWEAKEAKAAQRAREIEAKGVALTDTLKAKHEGATVQIEYRTRTLIEKVHDVIPQAANCPLPDAAVGLLNAAITGSEVPPASGGPVETTAGVEASDLLANSIFNVGVAQQALDEARTWREWYVKQAGLRGPVDIPDF